MARVKDTPMAPTKRGRIPAAEAEGRNVRILDSATGVFLAEGFDRATMTRLAKRAGCSLETLYAAYPNKEVMFSALIARKASTLFHEVGGLEPERELREGLTAYAIGILSMMGQPDTRELQRLVIGASQTFPELASNFWKKGPGCSLRDLTEFFLAKKEQGDLVLESPSRAAEVFMALLIGDLTMRSTLGMKTHVDTRKQQAEWAAVSVELFATLLERGRL